MKRKWGQQKDTHGRNDVFGFKQMSKKQKQGVKQAMAIRETQIRQELTGEDGQPGPVARQSVMDRLGQLEEAMDSDPKRANLATFLKDINEC
jgi:hypothetical protein